MARKYISWKTKTAAALAELGNARYGVPYDDVKRMTEDQFLSLWEWDHNIFHSASRSVARPKGGLKFTPIDPDVFWNLTPMLIKTHRKKTKRDLKTIAKSRRIRKRNSAGAGRWPLPGSRVFPLRIGPDAECRTHGASEVAIHPARKIRSRGFDKTRKRKMDGTVVKR